MIPSRQIVHPPSTQNPLWISYHDTQTLASIDPSNVMDYFCRKSNPFYDHMCNNETVRMQRQSLDHLNNMVGVEYILLHVSAPYLYVIRKQHRHSPTEATPLANYYIVNGHIFKAPDLGSLINARILSTITNLQTAYEESSSFARYHPNKGYYWDFSANKAFSEKSKAKDKKDTSPAKDDTATVFQTQRVEMLLADLLHKFPPRIPPHIQQQFQQEVAAGTGDAAPNQEASETQPMDDTPSTSAATPGSTSEIKSEVIDMKPPPEKKPKV